MSHSVASQVRQYMLRFKTNQNTERFLSVMFDELLSPLFLEFLAKNNALIRNGRKVISDGALVAITLMIAESRPEEKDIMVALVMNFLTL